MQAIELLKAEPEEPKVSVGKKFYDQFEVNSDAFDKMLVEEEEVTTEKAKVTGNDAKIIHMLKAMKSEPRLTDNQEEKIDRMISLWENGEIPAKISKDVMKKMKLATDVLALYYDILNIVPASYFEERKSQRRLLDGEKQIVLSCYLKNGGAQ